MDFQCFSVHQVVFVLGNMGDAVIGVIPELSMLDVDFDEMMDENVRMDTVTIVISPEMQMSFYALASSWKPTFIGVRFQGEWTEVAVTWNPTHF